MQHITRSHGNRNSIYPSIATAPTWPTMLTNISSIIRILLMIPIYSTVSFLSYLYYKHSIYFEVLRDCYEAFAIASFFTLLCNYIAPNLHEQKDYFRQVTPINWFWGVFGLQKCTGGKEKGILRIPRSGLTWFNVRALYPLRHLSPSLLVSMLILIAGHLVFSLPICAGSRAVHYSQRSH